MKKNARGLAGVILGLGAVWVLTACDNIYAPVKDPFLRTAPVVDQDAKAPPRLLTKAELMEINNFLLMTRQEMRAQAEDVVKAKGVKPEDFPILRKDFGDQGVRWETMMGTREERLKNQGKIAAGTNPTPNLLEAIRLLRAEILNYNLYFKDWDKLQPDTDRQLLSELGQARERLNQYQEPMPAGSPIKNPK